MSGAPPVIIEAALNGAKPKSKFPNVPRSADEVAADALACLSAGAAIVHAHIDEIGVSPDRSAAAYEAQYRLILEQRQDALFYPTVGFCQRVEESLGHLPLLQQSTGLRIGLIEPGSVNLGKFAYINSPADIEYMVSLCDRLQLGPSIAIYEPGFLRHVLKYFTRGALPRGSFIKFYLGGTYADAGFGLPPTPRMLDVYLEILGDCPLPWSVGVLGGDVFEHGVARHALERGGHLHVGLEDYAGHVQVTNAELVSQAVDLCRKTGLTVASCSEAAIQLDLPAPSLRK